MSRWKSVLFALLVSLWCAPVAGATVAILRPRNDTPELGAALFRLQGELSAVGLAVAIAERPPSADTGSAEAEAWFESVAAERRIDAFIDVVGEQRPVAVDVWLCERSPRRLRMSRVVLEADATDAAAALAIHAIEVLRSSFLAQDLAGERPPPAPVPPPDRAAPAPPPPERARFGFALGATALTSLDGVGPSILPLVRFEWAARSWLLLQATGAGFGTRPRVEAEAGSVQVAQEFALLGLCTGHSSKTGFWPFLAVAAGLLHTGLDGRARLPNRGHRLDRWAFVVDASVGVRLNLPGRYYLALASHAQVAEPYVAIHFVDSVVATTGRPNLLLSLTAGAAL